MITYSSSDYVTNEPSSRKFTHQFHGLQVKISVSLKYTDKQQADTTMKTREEAEAAVRAHVPSRVLLDILTYIRKNPPVLWGLNQGHSFLRSYSLLALYKDISCTGYSVLYEEVGSWLRSCPKTLHHNTQVLHLSFAAWAKTMDNLGSLEEWQHAANPLCLKRPLKELCLWIDSFNLALEGKKTTS